MFPAYSYCSLIYFSLLLSFLFFFGRGVTAKESLRLYLSQVFAFTLLAYNLFLMLLTVSATDKLPIYLTSINAFILSFSLRTF